MNLFNEPVRTGANIVADYMARLTPEERLLFLDRLHDRFCPHCGREQPTDDEKGTRQCQCWNDE